MAKGISKHLKTTTNSKINENKIRNRIKICDKHH